MSPCACLASEVVSSHYRSPCKEDVNGLVHKYSMWLHQCSGCRINMTRATGDKPAAHASGFLAGLSGGQQSGARVGLKPLAPPPSQVPSCATRLQQSSHITRAGLDLETKSPPVLSCIHYPRSDANNLHCSISNWQNPGTCALT